MDDFDKTQGDLPLNDVVDNEVGSVKKMNKLVVYILMGIMAIGLIAIMYGFSKASQKPSANVAAGLPEETVALPAELPQTIENQAVEGVIPQAPVGATTPPVLQRDSVVIIPNANGEITGTLAGGSSQKADWEIQADEHRAELASMRHELNMERQRYEISRGLESRKSADVDARIALDSAMNVSLNITGGQTGGNTANLSLAQLSGANGLQSLSNPASAAQGALGSLASGINPTLGGQNAPSGVVTPSDSISQQLELLRALGGQGGGGAGIGGAGAAAGLDANGQDSKVAFLNNPSVNIDEDYLDRTIQKPKSPYELKQGTIIPGAMVTGINSDLPGRIIGQVSQNVYDTSSGAHLLIPQGTRIFGQYDSSITFGQNRALIVWNRLIFPNGKSINLDVMAGVDQSGYAGLRDKTNRHLVSLYGQAILLSAVGAGIDLLAGDDSRTNNFQTDPFTREERLQNAIRGEFSDNLQSVTARVLDRNLDRQPTIVIRPGKPFAILVDRDIVLEPYQ